MAICIDGDFVCLSGGCFCETSTGLEFSGIATAVTFCNLAPTFQGETFGYTAGGYCTTPSGTEVNIIDRFTFASDATPATDTGDLSVARREVSGQSSSVSGYTSGGSSPPSDVIDKFPFAGGGNATDVGNLTLARALSAGQSSTASGYTSGGDPATNRIDKFPFSADNNATDVGDLSSNRQRLAGQSSTVSGYSSGGCTSTTVIDKFPFASDGTATDVGDLAEGRWCLSGVSSETSGYSTGGFASFINTRDTIDKFPFATDTNATDVTNLAGARRLGAGISSVGAGYTSGGSRGPSPFTICADIEKFAFASDSPSRVGANLSCCRAAAAGTQF